MLVAMPKDMWKTAFVKEVLDFVKEKKDTTTKNNLYKGELEQKHGVVQANRHVAIGKWSESEDSDGEQIFRKAEKDRDKHDGSRNSEVGEDLWCSFL